ncbi:MAG: hypothetical protein E7012_00055 [Alphaproteobacteria bacterium]|nr:hypothetical protein [Alphaproteobacteria bacterium]
MRIFLVLLLSIFFSTKVANAQYTSQKDAMYIATLKAVVNYKINDEENLSDIEDLRQNLRFNQRLQKMLDKLKNTRTKNSTNKKVYNILLKAGEEIYKELD